MLNLSGQSLGRYHIIEPLGEGGMATVYKAFDTRLECDVAIKFIQHEHITPGQWQKMLKRFENEAKRMAKFTHPNIVKVTDYGEYNGTPYLVMEYLAGGTLKTLLKSRNGKPLSFHEAVHILLPIAHALDYTHRQDTIHRDVKPANILITDDGALMLTDFGVAKILDIDDGQTLTGVNVGVGTPKYMAPEQWQNQISSQTDVYALGVVFYEMLTGHVPYDADTPAGIYAKQLTEPLTQPRAYVPDLPEEVEKVLYKAMAKKPEDRYKNMGAFVNALERLPQLPLSVSDKVDSTPVTNEYLSEQPQASVVVSPHSEEPNDSIPNSDATRKISSSPPLFSQPVQSVNQEKSESKPVVWLLLGLGGLGLLVLFIVIIFVSSSNKLSDQKAIEQAIVMTQRTSSATDVVAVQPPTIKPPDMTSTSEGKTRISDKDEMMSVYIPAGDFLMGSYDSDNDAESDEKPQHKVYLDEYWMDRTEVTNVMFAKYVEEAGYKTDAEKEGWGYAFDVQKETSGADWQHPRGPGNSITGKGDYPVVQVSWNDANGYCKWAGGRLPSEAEWEKAARGTDRRKYPWGNDEPSVLLSNTYGKDTVAVGSYPTGVSPYGIMDMAGNVWEWVNDRYDENYYQNSPERNPLGAINGQYRVLRGGSWLDRFINDRVTDRLFLEPVVRYDNVGFRCVRLY